MTKEKGKMLIRLQFSRYIILAQWLSWLERCPVTAEVAGSSPAWVVNIFGYYLWGLSSAGRASALQAEGHRFEPCRSHYQNQSMSCRCGSMAEQLICNQQVIGSSPIIGFFGWIPEWPKGADCNSVSIAFEGSNPSPPTLENSRTAQYSKIFSKLNIAGWSSLEARRAHNPKVIGSNPVPAIFCPDSSVGRARD